VSTPLEINLISNGAGPEIAEAACAVSQRLRRIASHR